MISIKNISKSFSGQEVLRSISLELSDKNCHVFLGSSGCGKSSLLRLILGFIHPSSGDVLIGGKNIQKFSRTERGETFGYVLQGSALYPHLSARQNVELPGRTHAWGDEKLSRRVNELGDMVGLDSFLLDKFPNQLSGGQRQRVGLMRALVLDPPILLMDEPLSALDPMIRLNLQEELCELFKKLQKTVVFVTHDLQEANLLGDVVYLMNHGKIEQTGSFEELLKNPASDYTYEFFEAQLKHAVSRPSRGL